MPLILGSMPPNLGTISRILGKLNEPRILGEREGRCPKIRGNTKLTFSPLILGRYLESWDYTFNLERLNVLRTLGE